LSWAESLFVAAIPSLLALAKKNYTGQIPTVAWIGQKKFMLPVSSIKSAVFKRCITSVGSMARGALKRDAFEKPNHPSDRPGGKLRVDACEFPPVLRA
jgi:hypothetical protein